MAKQQRRHKQVQVSDLQDRLSELESTLSAIRSGEVDALVVEGPEGDRIFSLRGAEQPYRVFVEQMQEGAVTLDEDGTILYANKRFAQLLSLPLERVIGSSLASHIPERECPAVHDLLRRGEAGKTDCALVDADGHVVPVHLSLSVMSMEGVVVRCLVVTDLTQQHQQRALQLANAAKDQFLAALSHELRTPLTPVLMTTASLARRKDLPEDVLPDIEMMNRNIELEARLIDDLLDLTRITRGKLEISPRPADTHELLENSVRIISAEAAEKQLKIVTDLRAENHWVMAEPVRLHQVFWNVLRNAVKFTPRDGTIHIRTYNEPKSGALLIEVQDSGIGIPAGRLCTIFDAFEQGDPEVTRQFGGLGLGLAISKHLMELHGGSIVAHSAGENLGSTFTLRLKTIAAPAARTQSKVPPKKLATRPLRILLVEDHDDTRRKMERLLTTMHHEVDAASNARVALSKAASREYDLVISDLGLPDVSGFDLMTQLRQQHERLRGICLSGYGMEDDILRSRDAGFFCHLTKPINLDQLEAALQAASDVGKVAAGKR